MTTTVTIDGSWVDDQMKKLCARHRKDRLMECLRSTNGESRVHWRDCAECVAESFVGVKGAVFSSPVRDWCDPETEILHNCLEKSLNNIDWLLHLSKKRYRDHASHQLFVGTLGSFLLQCRVGPTATDGNGQTLGQWIAEKLSLKEAEVEIAWWLASLLHDHAYPLSHMLRVTPSLAGMDDPAKRNLLDHTWTLLGSGSEQYCENSAIQGLYEPEFLARLRTAIQPDTPKERREALYGVLLEYLTPFFPQARELHQDPKDCYDHGILAAANLAALMPCSREGNILNLVIRAIGIHNGAACRESIVADQDPLAFLLVLCDEWQEWERRIVVNDSAQVESTQIRLGDVQKLESEEYAIGEHLTAVFEYPCAGVLEKTEWDYSRFNASKKKALARLCVSDGFPIKQASYHIQIPYGREFDMVPQVP